MGQFEALINLKVVFCTTHYLTKLAYNEENKIAHRNYYRVIIFILYING